MIWTFDKPTQPGWYIWRRSTGDFWSTIPALYKIDFIAGQLCFLDGTPIDKEIGEWSAEPIPEPQEQG